MKKIGKLSINPEKVIKNEELVNLKGGYGTSGGVCVCCTISGSGNCVSEGYFFAPFNNCDDALDWAYSQCSSYNTACNPNISCPPIS